MSNPPLVHVPLDYLTHPQTKETICVVTLHGPNRDSRVLEWHKKVMVDYMGIPVNYIECPFPRVSHGGAMNQLLAQTVDLPNAPDYYYFCDNDNIHMRRGAMDLVYGFVCNKLTVFGESWQSNHKFGPRGVVHAYASQAALCFSRQLYNALGRPDMDHYNPRSDTAEEFTYIAKERGFIVALLYPSHVVDPNTPLDNSCFQGFGNTYGPNLMFHCSQVPNPRHVDLFVEKCQEVVAGKYEVSNHG